MDSVSFWTILCEPLLNNLIPTSLSHEWLLVLYLGLLPIHQLMSQQKQHFSLPFLLNTSFFFRRRNSSKWLSCLSREKCRKNNCPKRIFSWYCRKILRDCRLNGSYFRKIPNRYYEGRGLRLWKIQRGYSRNSISKFQGFIKKGVEFQGIKKNSCGICMGAWFLALDLGISKQQCNTILWNFQG